MFPSRSRRARAWPSWGRPERERPRSSASCPGSTTFSRARFCWMAWTSARCGGPTCAATSEPCCRTRCSFRAPSPATSACTARRAPTSRAAAFVNADRFIDRLPEGYDHEVRERGSNFSAGQRQLLAFARAIAFDPEVLLVLDEATSSVDTETETLIQDALERLMKGRTSIIIAHRLFTIRHVDRIIVLHKGKVVEQGTHDALLERQGYYHRLYELQYQEQEMAEVG